MNDGPVVLLRSFSRQFMLYIPLSAVLPRRVRHPGGGGAGRSPRGLLGDRQRAGRAAGAAAPPVPEVLPAGRGGPGAGPRRAGPGPGHLQGNRGGPRGRIWAESGGEGLGTRFTFTIPAVEEAPAPAAPPSSRRRRTPQTERERILVVDDDPQALRYVRDALTRAGYAPIVTGDPEEAPRLVEAHSPPPGAAGPGVPRSGRH